MTIERRVYSEQDIVQELLEESRERGQELTHEQLNIAYESLQRVMKRNNERGTSKRYPDTMSVAAYAQRVSPEAYVSFTQAEQAAIVAESIHRFRNAKVLIPDLQ